MNKYELYYKDILVANISIDENDNIIYKVINSSCDILEMLKKNFNGKLKEFPFIDSRINNMSKFNLDSVQYVNSSYKLIKIN